jgi:hypothetical protein
LCSAHLASFQIARFLLSANPQFRRSRVISSSDCTGPGSARRMALDQYPSILEVAAEYCALCSLITIVEPAYIALTYISLLLN